MNLSRLFSISAATLLAVSAGLASPTAQARARVYISTPDVVIESGQPYYRTDHSRLYVETGSSGPRYYRWDDRPVVAYHHRHHRRYYYRHHHRYYYRD